MNLGEAAAKTLAGALVTALPFDRVDAAIAPAFPCLRAVLDAVASSPLAVGAQNVHWEARGPFTGEVAASMLADMGVRFVIVGHSERRALFGETDATVAKKVVAARRHGLIPIICVGETEQERDHGRTRAVVLEQIRGAFDDLPTALPGEIVVAYEPVWAIGTGRTPDAADVTSAHAAIRAVLIDRFGAPFESVRILYGGSVTVANAPSLLRALEVDGALVGGASLDARDFASIAAASATGP